MRISAYYGSHLGVLHLGGGRKCVLGTDGSHLGVLHLGVWKKVRMVLLRKPFGCFTSGCVEESGSLVQSIFHWWMEPTDQHCGIIWPTRWHIYFNTELK
jgi:hypothetical protein